MNPELLQTITQKLETELANATDNFIPVSYIKDYLLNASQDNDYLAEMLLTSNRTLQACSTYMKQEITQTLIQQTNFDSLQTDHYKSVCMVSDEVFGMAEDFYYLSDEEITKLLSPPPVNSKPLKPTVIPVPIQKPKVPPKQDLQLNLFDTPEQQPQEISIDESIEIEDKKITNEEPDDHEQEIA